VATLIVRPAATDSSTSTQLYTELAPRATKRNLVPFSSLLMKYHCILENGVYGNALMLGRK